MTKLQNLNPIIEALNMKKKNLLHLSILCFTLSAYADTNTTSMPAASMRQYKESEVGLGYTFSRVNLGGLNQLPAFISRNTQTSPTTTLYQFENLKTNPAWEFNFNYLQTLNSPENKVFLDVNYVHADGTTSTPISQGNNTTSITVNPLLGNTAGVLSNSNTSNVPYFASAKTEFNLASAQTGALKRFYRTKNIDFSVFGGVDIAYFNTTVKTNLLGHSNSGATLTYTKSSQNVDVASNQSSMTQSARNLAAPGVNPNYSSSFKSNYYGAGPLVGAKLQVPFNREFLRLNIKAEASALMGYGSNYFNYITGLLNDTSPYALSAINTYASKQSHVFRMVPTLRAELSLDVIIKNFMFTAGLQQQVYFQALDINSIVDLAEYSNGESAATTRSRLGQIVNGGPFVKLSLLF